MIIHKRFSKLFMFTIKHDGAKIGNFTESLQLIVKFLVLTT